MSYPQFGYSYSTTPQLIMPSNALATCCESSTVSPVDSAGTASPQSSLYYPVYEGKLLASARHDLNSTSTVGVYGSPYAKNPGYGTYNSYGTDSTSPYALGKLDETDRTGPAYSRATQNYYPYEHPFGQYQYDRYGYASVEVGTRRKNATRETTSTLKAWLQEHKKNPYPTKGEKIMLAIITKMTLTQVSTWFANARRRLKKENKMTWSPRNKTSEEKGCDDVSDDGDGSQGDPGKYESEFDDIRREEDTDPPQSDLEDFDLTGSDSSESDPKPLFPINAQPKTHGNSDDHFKEPSFSIPESARVYEDFSPGCLRSPSEGHQTEKTYYLEQDQHTAGNKPKIWSLAQTATLLNQTQYSSCMHRSQVTESLSAECLFDSEVVKRQKDSPVDTLRNWVDGVFHDPLFRQGTFNQTFSNSSTLWIESNCTMSDNGLLGRSVGPVTSS